MKPKTFAILCLSLFTFVLFCSQTPEDPFKGITNKKVLPMLKHLPYEHGGFNISATDGRFLHDLILDKDLKRGLEIGTSNGYSTLWLGLAFSQTNGRIITIEINEDRGKEARANFKKAGLHKVIDSRINDALKEIPEIEGEFDFVFIDAWKPDYIKYFNLLKNRIMPGGVITAHNVSSNRYSMRNFLEIIKKDQSFITTVHRMDNTGISVSVKK